MTPAARAPQVELLYPGVGVGSHLDGPKPYPIPDRIRYLRWYPAAALYPGRSGSELVPRLALHVTQRPSAQQAARALRDHQRRTRQRVDQLLSGGVRISVRRPT